MMNRIGIDNTLDWERIRHLFKIGIFAALLVLIGDFLLGWGTADESLTGIEGYFSRYLTVSDVRIFWSALLGLVGIPLECLSYFGVYRLIAAKSEKYAHAYRSGIFGMMIFGAPVHVLCCAAIFHFKALYAIAPAYAADRAVRFALYFLMPAAAVMAVFFFLLAIVQIIAFLKGATPLPERCAVFFRIDWICCDRCGKAFREQSHCLCHIYRLDQLRKSLVVWRIAGCFLLARGGNKSCSGIMWLAFTIFLSTSSTGKPTRHFAALLRIL